MPPHSQPTNSFGTHPSWNAYHVPISAPSTTADIPPLFGSAAAAAPPQQPQHPYYGNFFAPNVPYAINSTQAQIQAELTRRTARYSSFLLPEATQTTDLRRLTQITTVFKTQELAFSGKTSEDPELFLTRLRECSNMLSLTQDEVFRSLFVVFKGEALTCFHLEKNKWISYQDFVFSFLTQYGKVNPQESLLSQVHKRLQRKNETITSYITAMRALFARFVPPLDLAYSLDLTFDNLHQDYLAHIFRYQFTSFDQL